jgi:hypothetical protein
LREALPALVGLGDKAPDEALADWLPDAWQQRQQASALSSAAALPA